MCGDRLDGVDGIVLSLSAKDLTTSEISAHPHEVYGASVRKALAAGTPMHLIAHEDVLVFAKLQPTSGDTSHAAGAARADRPVGPRSPRRVTPTNAKEPHRVLDI
jgi:hypothetical protein